LPHRLWVFQALPIDITLVSFWKEQDRPASLYPAIIAVPPIDPLLDPRIQSGGSAKAPLLPSCGPLVNSTKSVFLPPVKRPKIFNDGFMDVDRY
ncbi:hypothetical protein PFISCL1PPCAC_12821, partial [Pristionchus fissidentatus]